MKIRHLAAAEKLHVGMTLEEREHVRAMLQEHLHARAEDVAVQRVAQVGAGLFGVFVDAFGHRQRIARDPQPAAGPGGGAAQYRVLFYQDHPFAQVRGADGGCQAGRAGADHQQVAVVQVLAAADLAVRQGRCHAQPLQQGGVSGIGSRSRWRASEWRWKRVMVKPSQNGR